SGARAMPAPVRYQVDPDCLGRRAIERFLASARPAPSRSEDRAVVRLYSRPVVDPLQPFGDEPREGMVGAGLFSFDCQVVFDPAVQPAVTAIGAGTLVNLFRCGTPPAR